MANELVQVINENEARVNVTYAGQNGELAQPVFFESNDADIKAWITEALQAGSIPGLPVQRNVDLRDFVVDRYKPTEARPYNLIQVRPKTVFGFACDHCNECGVRALGGSCCGCGSFTK